MAQSIEAPASIRGAPGDVVSLPLRVVGGGSVDVRTPQGLLFLGLSSTAATGRVLATILIPPGTRAGDYQVTIVTSSNGSASGSRTVTLTVLPKPDLALSVQPPGYVTTGAATRIPVHVTNQGNAPDTVHLSANGDDPTNLSTDTLALQPGASGAATLDVTPGGVGERYATVVATSSIDAAYSKSVLVSYTALALGAKSAEAPFLQFAFPLGLSYGSSGLDYRGGIDLSGNLSDFVSTAASLSLVPSSIGTSLSFLGKNWSALYGFDSATGHDLSLSYDNWNARANLDAHDALTTGIGYSSGPWSVRYDHRWGPGATDTLAGTYGVQLSSPVHVSGTAGAFGEVRQDGTYHVSPLAGASLSWIGPVIGASVGATVIPWSSSPWRVSAHAFSRATKPVRFDASASAAPATIDANVGVQEDLSDVVTMAQRVTYSLQTGGTMQFGVRYAPTTQPVTVLGIVGVAYDGSVLTGSGSLSAVITKLPWLSTAEVAVSNGATTLSYGQTYLGPDYSLGGSIAIPIGGVPAPTIALRGVYAPSTWDIGASGAYDFANASWAASGTLGFQIATDTSLYGTVGYDSTEGLTWQVGASATLVTGVAVPSQVVGAFGGLDQGTIAGTVTIRSADGSTRPGTGLSVSVPSQDVVTKTDAQGHYSLSVAPGTVQLDFPGLPANLSLDASAAKPVTVPLHATVRHDVVLDVSYAITGQVFADVAGTGKPTSDSYGLAGVSVHLTGPKGTTQTAVTDATGAFSFPSLEPGAYSVGIVAGSLPKDFEPKVAPVQVTVSDASSPFVSLPARPVPTTVTNTLNSKTLAMAVTVSPTEAPPGAVVHVTVQASKATQVRANIGAGTATVLKRGSAGVFDGDVTVPTSAAGVAIVNVEASNTEASATQTQMVFVSPGPLATLALDPSYVAPGSTVHVSAKLLVNAQHVTVTVGGTTHELTARGTRSYAGDILAPSTDGHYPVVLSVDGKTLARSTLVVSQGP
ncbi:MAG: SdrD B-like domain-containing protein [Deinococcales bacterium]